MGMPEMMNYQEMSDEQIEFAVSDALSIPRGDKWCSDWAETGQIIQDYDISLLNDGNGIWHATHKACWVDGVEWQIDGTMDKNPLRAAMVAFLMMKGGE